MSIMISSSLPRSSPAEFRTLSPASVLAARTRRYFLSGSAFLILFCIEMLLILLEPCTFDAYRASRARRCCSLRSIGRGDDLPRWIRSEEHTSELQSPCNLVCRLLLLKEIYHRSLSPRTCPAAPKNLTLRSSLPRNVVLLTHFFLNKRAPTEISPFPLRDAFPH